MEHVLEEISLNAWPALHTVLYDGWVLRFAAGYTRRANSVNPLYPGSGDPAAKIRACEALYRARGQATVFKITPAVEPGGLDATLAAAGYRREAPTSVQTLRLDACDPPQPTRAVRRARRATVRWLDTYCALNAVDPRHRPAMARMLAGIVAAHCFLTLEHAGAPVAVGLAVAERGWVGLFDLVVAPALRNQGWGRRLVLHLLAWGRAQGAEHAYLQVMPANAPAFHLYRRLGFREVYSYWYRVKAL